MINIRPRFHITELTLGIFLPLEQDSLDKEQMQTSPFRRTPPIGGKKRIATISLRTGFAMMQKGALPEGNAP